MTNKLHKLHVDINNAVKNSKFGPQEDYFFTVLSSIRNDLDCFGLAENLRKDVEETINDLKNKFFPSYNIDKAVDSSTSSKDTHVPDRPTTPRCKNYEARRSFVKEPEANVRASFSNQANARSHTPAIKQPLLPQQAPIRSHSSTGNFENIKRFNPNQARIDNYAEPVSEQQEEQNCSATSEGRTTIAKRWIHDLKLEESMSKSVEPIHDADLAEQRAKIQAVLCDMVCIFLFVRMYFLVTTYFRILAILISIQLMKSSKHFTD